MITTIEKIKNYLLIDIEESFESQIVDWILDVEDIINKETGRQIIADDSASERTFVSKGGCELVIDEFVMSGDYSELVVTDEDGNDIEVDATPYNRDPKYVISGYFPKGKITVKARWGYSDEPPRPLVWAATVMVAGIINQSNQHDGEVQSETIGRYTVTYKTKQEQEDFKTSRDIIKRYQRYAF